MENHWILYKLFVVLNFVKCFFWVVWLSSSNCLFPKLPLIFFIASARWSFGPFSNSISGVVSIRVWVFFSYCPYKARLNICSVTFPKLIVTGGMLTNERSCKVNVHVLAICVDIYVTLCFETKLKSRFFTIWILFSKFNKTKVPYYMKFWRHFNLAILAIFQKIAKLKFTKIKCR